MNGLGILQVRKRAARMGRNPATGEAIQIKAKRADYWKEENLDIFDRVIVPSDHNLELFSRYNPNVVKVPLGVDTSEWHYVARETLCMREKRSLLWL